MCNLLWYKSGWKSANILFKIHLKYYQSIRNLIFSGNTLNKTSTLYHVRHFSSSMMHAQSESVITAESKKASLTDDGLKWSAISSLVRHGGM